MKVIGQLALAGASVLALSVPAFAQDTKTADNTGNEVTETNGDIVVSARRRDEREQDVPLVVNAFTAESIQKLNIREFQEVQSLVPGLSLATSANGVGTQAALRGVAYDVNASGNNGTIEFYLNDSPTSSGVVFQSLFDVSQIEVLRGPQGTLRGRASPSGSITITTRRPDLSEVGGYMNLTGTTRNAINVNGAFGLPIVQDVLALRVAGVYEENDGNRVHSLNNGVNPFVKTQGGRVSLSFDPADFITVDGSFTKTVRDALQFDQVESANIAAPGLGASPVLVRASDRSSVEAKPRKFRQDFDVWNLRAELRFAGQKLNYVGGYNKQSYATSDPNDKGGAFLTSPLVVFPDLPTFLGGTVVAPTFGPQASFAQLSQDASTRSTQETHELRLSSDERLFGMVDYIIGGLINKQNSLTSLNTQTPLINLPIPLPAGGFLFSPTLVNNTPVLRPAKTLEKSVFANLTVHFGEKTEVSGGARYIYYRDRSQLQIFNGRTGAFDNIVPADRSNAPAESAWIYSASVKHRFSDSFMAYANFGTSFRPGGTTNAIIDLNNAFKSPRLSSLLFLQAERSKSYEVGFKSDLLDRRLRLNVTAYLQNFKNYAYSSPNVYTVATSDPTGRDPAQEFVAQATPALAVGVPVRVKGVEAELAWNTPRFSASATVSYSDAKITNGVIPCNNYGGAAPSVAQIRAASGGETVALCTVNFRAGTLPPFSATLQAEYNAAISGRVDGYIRGLASIFGNSQNDPGNPLDDVKAYGLVNLYTGVRDPGGAWDVGFFVKNLFDTDRVLSRDASAYGTPYQNILLGANAGQTVVSTYRGIATTPAREFGLNVRYSFGSL